MEATRKQTTSIQSRIIRELEAAPNKMNYVWSEFEDEVMKKYYGVKKTGDIARILNKTVDQVYKRGRLLEKRK